MVEVREIRVQRGDAESTEEAQRRALGRGRYGGDLGPTIGLRSLVAGRDSATAIPRG